MPEFRSVIEPRRFREVAHRFFGHLARLMEEHDADAPIQFVEIVPPEARAEEFAEIAAEHGMPLKQFTRLCVLGGDDENPDAFEALSGYLTLAKRAGTVDRLNIQVLGDSTTPSLDALCGFYLRAEEMAQAQGIGLYTETHVDRFSHDPRRLLAVRDRLRETTGGCTGLRVAADFSHYLHQIGNPHFPQWPAIASGELNLDPLDPDNLISRRIVEAGWSATATCARPCRTTCRAAAAAFNIRSPIRAATRRPPPCRTAAWTGRGSLHGCVPGSGSIDRSSRISLHIPGVRWPASRRSTWATERRATSASSRTGTSIRIWRPSPLPIP